MILSSIKYYYESFDTYKTFHCVSPELVSIFMLSFILFCFLDRGRRFSLIGQPLFLTPEVDRNRTR